MAWVGQSIERVEDAALLTGRGRYIDDLGVSRPARCMPPCCARRTRMRSIRAIDVDAARAAKGVAAVITAAEVTALGAPLLAGVKAQHPVLADRGRARALCRRAGRRGGGGRPLPRRGRAGADRGRLRAAADHLAARRCARSPTAPCCTKGSARTSRATARSATAIRKPRSRRAAHRVSVDGQLSAQFLHADRNLRADRRLRSGRGRLRCARDLPGAVQHPRGAGARAESAGQPAAPAHAAGCRRQLRREAGHLPLHRADGDRGARRRPPGEMDRGPARASHRLGVGHQSADHARGGGRGRRPRHGAGVGSGRGCRRAYPRAGARHALSHARQPHRRLRHPPTSRCATAW